MLDGGGIVTFSLPPSISFALDHQFIPGFPIYISSPYEFRYRCTNSPNLTRRAAISILGDFGPIRQALRDASLSVAVVYDSLEKGIWNPDPTAAACSPFFSVDDPYQGDSGERLGRIFLLLYAEKSVTRPLRVFLPPSFAFKLIADETAGGGSGHLSQVHCLALPVHPLLRRRGQRRQHGHLRHRPDHGQLQRQVAAGQAVQCNDPHE
ncbi:hypothetical protein ACOTH1_03900 [Achromobacter ruhlandii]|uniref:hypothetical protein n=1 Tax=Achromobacter ruhlandii TaxID=72557 RepID=UPI003B9C9CA2